MAPCFTHAPPPTPLQVLRLAAAGTARLRGLSAHEAGEAELGEPPQQLGVRLCGLLMRGPPVRAPYHTTTGIRLRLGSPSTPRVDAVCPDEHPARLDALKGEPSARETALAPNRR